MPKSLEKGATACVQRSLDHAYVFPYSKSVPQFICTCPGPPFTDFNFFLGLNLLN